MAVSSSRTEKIEGTITIGDLRELVKRTEAAPPESLVSVHEGVFSNHPTDHDRDRISVTWQI